MAALTHSASPLVDAHHHLWRYNADEFGWLDDSMAALRRDFTPVDLAAVMQRGQIDGAVAVQARCLIDETRYLLDCASASPAIWGVIGWLPLTEPNIGELLDEFTPYPLLRGLREITQGQPRAFDTPGFHDGIRAITARGLTYDILIYADQLAEATAFVDRHPQQRFVLDHAAKPHVREQELEPWSTHMRELARRPNVCCKLSGLAVEADWQHWTLDRLRPYLNVCMNAFGPQRLLAGSDWPVCLTATTYDRWWQTLREYLAPFSETEAAAILGGNAIREYSLTPRSSEVTP